MKSIFVFLFDGFADWEISFLTPEIVKSADFELIYFSKDGQPVTSMGGMQVVPSTSLSEIQLSDIDLLILPGGTAWDKGENQFIETLTKSVSAAGKPLAAICAATAFLAKTGLLNDIPHTSNDLYYLKAVAPDYRGDEFYVNAMAVTGQHIITAKGVAPIEFAREIFSHIELYDPATIEKWFQLFKNGIWSE